MLKITIPQTPDEVTQKHIDWVLINVAGLRKEIAGENDKIPGEIRWYKGNALRFTGHPDPFEDMDDAWMVVNTAQLKGIYIEIGNSIKEGKVRQTIAACKLMGSQGNEYLRHFSRRVHERISPFDITVCIMAAVME